MRTGILGGTFNPIHLAHLRIAEEVRERCGLDRILFIPTATPPHKELAQNVPFERRLEMVESAISGNRHFAASDMEGRRGGKSYSVETLEILHREHPGEEFFFIIGLDSFRDISTWREYRRLFSLANIVVVTRPGVHPGPPQELLPVAIREDFCYDAGSENIRHRSGTSLIFYEETLLDISSSGIRRLIGEGRSIRYLVPDGVEEYIRSRHLYREKERS